MSRTRRYTHSDLKGLTKSQLIRLIEAQPQHIPNPFNRSKLRKASLIELILSPTTPFRTSDPPLDDVVNVESQDLGAPNDGIHQSDMERSGSLLPEGDRHDSESEAPGPEAMNEDVEPAPGDRGNLELRLYIEDGHHPGTVHERTSKTINVEATLLAPNVVEIQTHDIIRELQAGFGAITGSDSVRVGLQDLVSPEYTEFFVESSPSSLYMSPTDPRTHVIHVEPGRRPFLRLRVDYSCPSTRESTRSHEQGSPPPAVPLAPAPNDRTPLIHWLRSKAAEKDEYSVFNQSKHHVRQNSDVYQSWKLAAEFSKHYYKQVHPFHSIAGKIKKSDIYNALEVGETWLSQAEEAERIIHIFGDGGTHPSPEVINRLTQSSGSPEGSVSLLRFLREWNRTHNPDL